jgi:hypothetical protein
LSVVCAEDNRRAGGESEAKMRNIFGKCLVFGFAAERENLQGKKRFLDDLELLG